jgi:hypothetical protein
VLGLIFWPKKGEGTWQMETNSNRGIPDLHFSPNIIRVAKSWMLGHMEHANIYIYIYIYIYIHTHTHTHTHKMYVSHTVHYKAINVRKIKKQMHCNCVSFLKMYVFIYLFIAATCFGYSLAIIKVLIIWYSGRTMYIFKIHLFTLVFLRFNLPCVEIISKILKMLYLQ